MGPGICMFMSTLSDMFIIRKFQKQGVFLGEGNIIRSTGKLRIMTLKI
jgi:hypothetical protein